MMAEDNGGSDPGSPDYQAEILGWRELDRAYKNLARDILLTKGYLQKDVPTYDEDLWRAIFVAVNAAPDKEG
jgi:hypothetical protein